MMLVIVSFVHKLGIKLTSETKGYRMKIHEPIIIVEYRGYY